MKTYHEVPSRKSKETPTGHGFTAPKTATRILALLALMFTGFFLSCATDQPLSQETGSQEAAVQEAASQASTVQTPTSQQTNQGDTAANNPSTMEPSAEWTYPESRKGDVTDTYFDTEVADPYRWLEDDMSEETGAWVRAQNDVTFDYLDQIPFRNKVRDRIAEHWNYERVGAPTEHGAYTYYSRNDGLQNQSVVYRVRTGDEAAEPEVYLDPNQFSEDGTTSLAGLSFTNDGSMSAHSISVGGSDWRSVITMNTETREVLGDTLTNIKFSGISWFGNRGFFYSSYEQPDGSELSAKTDQHKLFFHAVGSSQSEDELIFGGEDMPRRYVFGSVTDDDRYLIISGSVSTTGNELYMIDLMADEKNLVPIVDNFDHDHSVIDSDESYLYIYTNLDAETYKVVRAPLDNPTPENWEDVIPYTHHVLTASTAGGSIFASYLVDVKTQVLQYDYEGNLIRTVELPGIGTAGGFSGDREDTTLHYSFTSFTYPSTLFEYDIESGESTLYWSPSMDFNPEEYVTEQVFYLSKDSTRIPMFITYKKGLEMDGSNPTELYAYGGFNISLRPSFSVSRLIWLENGGIYAQPNIRGGGEYGREWHVAGTQMNKQNVFDDFMAAADYLVANGYTSNDKLAISGGSNGGLLVGAVMTQAPDLAAVAFPAVGVLDMLRYHTFTAGAGWAFDYGTSEDSPEMFEYLLGYSPVHNVREGVTYPSTMITTADHDDRVVPAHSFKFAAELQDKHGGDNPVLIRVETNAGHGAGRSTESRIAELADKYSFAWFEMGVNPF